jgi:hypothetical protein
MFEKFITVCENLIAPIMAEPSKKPFNTAIALLSLNESSVLLLA